MNDISAYLRENKIKPSFQRIKIFDYLVTRKNHPTVEMIHKELVKEIPTLSKTTVYNTLNTFVENKVVHIIVIEEHETRYDAILGDHGHFKCESCGKIYDIEVKRDTFDIKSLEKFQINEKHLYYKGICKKCLH